jgi:hypothetical protein
MRDKEKIQKIGNDLKKLTGDLCRSRIDEEYAGLCEKLIDKMARKRNVPFLSGKKETWAASIVYTIGQINFLFDRSFEPFMEGGDICSFFDVSRSVVSNKSKRIREMFRIEHWDDEFSTERYRGKHPLNDFVMLNNGLIVSKDQLKEMIFNGIISRVEEEGIVEDENEMERAPDKQKTMQSELGINDGIKSDRKQKSILDY